MVCYRISGSLYLVLLAVLIVGQRSQVVAQDQDQGLSQESAEERVQELYAELASKRTVEGEPMDDGFESFEVDAAGKKLKCVSKLYGNAEVGKRSLFISMHGGGGAPARINDQQWQNQIKLYKPKEGYYVAPRAPTNTWNLWHESHIDVLFGRMIEDFVASKGVDPNRVYLMGYSAGGDGVYQLAPRMADRFAAASMMAGHPNGVSADGLFNLPFRIYMGGKDSAYKRNEVAAQWKEKLASLQKANGGYPHKVTIYPELGHWMERKDAEAVPWMAEQTREPWPKKVRWGETPNRADRFYWIGGVKSGTIQAVVEGQNISLTGVEGEKSKDQKVKLWLRDQLVDLDKPITITIDQKVVHEGVVPRSESAIKESLNQRLDPAMAATAVIVVGQ
jgi:pimeloyl-ACP methyl ester carboxylesterase